MCSLIAHTGYPKDWLESWWVIHVGFLSLIIPIICFYQARFYREEPDLVRSSETSMYSDFMTCQGRAGREEKRHVRKLLERTNGDSSSQLKKKVLELMEEVPLRILALPDSK